MAHSKKLGVTAGLIDAAKGVFAVWLGYSLGLDLSLQIWVGLAVIAGHNWSIFLNFKGGRGVAIVIGLIWALLFNPEYSIWIPILYVVIGLSLVALIHSTPLPVLVMTALLPVFSAVFMHDYGVTGAFIALLAVVVLKRLLPSRRALTVNRHVMINRLLYDRDIKDSKVWMYRESTEEKKEINP